MQIKKTILYKEDILPEGLSSNETTTRKYVFSSTTYDRQGNVLVEERFSPEGHVEDRVENEYDDQGRLLVYKNIIQGEVAEHKSWEYDGDKVLREFIHYVDGSKDAVVYAYDENGRVVSATQYDEDGELESETLFEYDGGTVKEISRDAEGEITEEKKSVSENDKETYQYRKDHFSGDVLALGYEYDDQGRLAVTYRYDEEGNILEKAAYEYDANNHVVRINQQAGDTSSDVLFTYDDSGNTVKQVEQQQDGTIVSSIERDYDENNLHRRSVVFLNGMGEQMSQNYNVIHEYEFFE